MPYRDILLRVVFLSDKFLKKLRFKEERTPLSVPSVEAWEAPPSIWSGDSDDMVARDDSDDAYVNVGRSQWACGRAREVLKYLLPTAKGQPPCDVRFREGCSHSVAKQKAEIGLCALFCREQVEAYRQGESRSVGARGRSSVLQSADCLDRRWW
jgi:hypothetical protein